MGWACFGAWQRTFAGAFTLYACRVWRDHCIKMLDKKKLHPLVFVMRMAVMAFVRATCSRGGSFGKDWYDRAGKMLYWMEKNVLSVNDYLHGHVR